VSRFSFQANIVTPVGRWAGLDGFDFMSGKTLLD
jgi:hypothetical protein